MALEQLREVRRGGLLRAPGARLQHEVCGRAPGSAGRGGAGGKAVWRSGAVRDEAGRRQCVSPVCKWVVTRRCRGSSAAWRGCAQWTSPQRTFCAGCGRSTDVGACVVCIPYHRLLSTFSMSSETSRLLREARQPVDTRTHTHTHLGRKRVGPEESNVCRWTSTPLPRPAPSNTRADTLLFRFRFGEPA